MERTTLEQLKLSGSNNIKRFNDRARAEADAPALTPTRKAEIEALDVLIAKALKACAKGSIRNRKQNPSFTHLSLLCNLREMLMRGHEPEKNNTADIIAAADKLMGLS
jgi:hypothetical protein